VSKPLDHSTAPDNLTLPGVLPHSEVVLLTEYMVVAVDDPTQLIISDPEDLVIVGPLTLEEFTSQIGPLTLRQYMHCRFFFFQPCQWGGDFFDYKPDLSSTPLATILATGTDRDTSHADLVEEGYADSLELDELASPSAGSPDKSSRTDGGNDEYMTAGIEADASVELAPMDVATGDGLVSGNDHVEKNDAGAGNGMQVIVWASNPFGFEHIDDLDQSPSGENDGTGIPEIEGDNGSGM